MAYIEPNSTIQLMENVPLDNSYRDTLWFDDVASQFAFFSGYVVQNGTFEKQYYQREKRGYCKLEGRAEDYIKCNYMRFRNISYGTKWFYAFILDVEYINDNTFRVIYEIDVMQTWLKEIQLGDCFVEREHTETDLYGEHIEPEPVQLGDYVTINSREYGIMDADNMRIIVAIAFGLPAN